MAVRAAGTYTVGEVAELSGVSVRTLHHYHEIGLLVPTVRSLAGYRLYSPDDLRRLRQILLYRELDFRLEEIADMLASPAAGTDDHLRRQHALLRARQDRFLPVRARRHHGERRPAFLTGGRRRAPGVSH